jgi:hypothetical protein
LLACTRGTANVSDIPPGEVQNEKGWRYYTVAFPEPGSIESIALCESQGAPYVAWRGVRLLDIGVRTRLYVSGATDTSLRNWDQFATIWKNVYDDPHYASDLSLADLDGTPALCFYGVSHSDDSDNVLFYMYRTGSDNELWSAPIAITSTGSAQFGCNMLNVAGNPSISFVDSHSGPPDQRHRMLFVRALDSQGASWPAPQVVYTGLWSVDAHPSAALVSGNPAICFAGRHTTGGGIAASNLSYVRSLDPLGETWGNAIILDLSPGAGEIAELAQIGPHPSVYYRVEPDSSQPSAAYEMRYLPALDATGFTWGTARFLGIGNGSQVVEVSGRAFASNAVIPQQSQLAGTPYITGRISRDDRGEQWSDEHFLDYSDQVSVHDLALIGGRPAIAYVEGGRIIYAVFYF